MGILLKYYKIYKEEGICEPPEVKEYTDNYQKQNDIFNEFMEEMISETEEDCSLSIKDCFAKFKIWFKKNYEGQKVPPQKELKINMEKKYIYNTKKGAKNKIGFKSKNGCGLKFIEEEEEDDMDPNLD